MSLDEYGTFVFGGLDEYGASVGTVLTEDGRFVFGATSAFPTQYSGLRVGDVGSVTTNLCLVAESDAPTGVGGRLLVKKGGTQYAIYLVATSDPNASRLRIRTSTATYAIRKKT